MKRHPRLSAAATKCLLRLAAMAPLAAGLLLATGCAGPEASRQLYQWTDAAGSVRYTAYPDLVPAARRETRRVVEPGASAFENASPARAPVPVASGTAGTPTGAPVEVPADASPLDRRIAELEASIAADEEALKQLISDPKMADTLRSSPDLRAIGERLPALQAELRALREQRATRDGASADDGGNAEGGSGGADGS